MEGVAVNTRILHATVTGVQRYTLEVLARWNGCVDTIMPVRPLHGFVGHAWEQFVLPLKLNGRVLFSPSNTGPVVVRRQVLTLHDMSVFDWPDTFSYAFVRWYQFLLPKLLQRTSLVITDSEFAKSRILAHIDVSPEKIRVVPLGVNRRFNPQAISRADYTKAVLNLPSSNYILTVGSLEPRKNLARLLRAWARIYQALPEDLWLFVAGSRVSTQVFADVGFDKLPPRVFLTGRVEDSELPSLYAGALGFIYVSLYEGFGLPPLEAMASGVPVATGCCSSLPEVVGDAGIMLDPKSEDDIARGIRTLADNGVLRGELAKRGLMRAKQFSWDETARKTWQILQEAAAA